LPKLKITVGGTAISLALGLLVFALALGIAWRNYRGAFYLGSDQVETRSRFRMIDERLSEYREQSGRLPASLGELPTAGLGQSYVDGEGRFLDGWGRPLLYSVSGSTYVVRSYGHDGRPGGAGLDCDLSSTDPSPPEALPTLRQFLFEMPSRGMVGTCVAAGLATCLIAFMMLAAPDTARKAVAPSLACLGLTVIGALTAAVFISALHIPNGH
jgi:hypothetical protein